MAKFELAPGEVTVSQHPIGLVVDRKSQAATLHLTDRRLVVVLVPEAPGWTVYFGTLGAELLGKFFSKQQPDRIAHQIVRDQLAEIEENGKLVVIRDTGEGYGHTSFAFQSKESFVAWQQRVHQWAAGIENSAPLPTAKLVDPDR